MWTHPDTQAGRGSTAARVALALAMASLATHGTAAQPGRFGIGGQIGAPGGLTLRAFLHAPGTRDARFDAVIVQASFNLDGYLLLQAHLTRDLPVPDSPIELFLGPGLAGGIDERDPVLGLGAMAGVRFYRRRFEVHFQLSPLLHVRPRLDGVMGAGVGLRYFL